MDELLSGRCIGLIGGLGVGAAVYYYQELAKAHTAHGRVLNLVMAHAHVDRVLGAVQADACRPRARSSRWSPRWRRTSRSPS
jgi:aspartate/glutamate racemase